MIEFFNDLKLVAPAAGVGAYAFVASDGSCRGWVQVIIRSHRGIEIHRLWTMPPGKGNGALMLRTMCELADRHDVEMTLKPLPFGRKPYPLNREELLAWYQRHGFEGTRRKMVRRPRAVSPVAIGRGFSYTH